MGRRHGRKRRGKGIDEGRGNDGDAPVGHETACESATGGMSIRICAMNPVKLQTASPVP
jgi:hypothetical protein